VCEIPGGALSRKEDGEEHVHGRWLMIRSAGRKDGPALGIVNSGQHGFDFFDGEIRLSMLRSAAYCHERGLDLSGGEQKYMDQGIHQIRLLACTGKPDELLERLPALADWLDAPPLAYAHLPMGRSPDPGAPATPAGGLPSVEDLLSLSPPGLRVTAVKRSEDGVALILRVHETTGHASSADLRLLQGGEKGEISFKPFEIKTLRIERSGGWREVDPLREE
jgi:alpha-mannosidase